VDEASRLEIVATLTAYQDNDYARVFDKEFFYFNKQAIMLTNVDEQGKSFESQLPLVTNKKTGETKRATSLKLDPIKLNNGEREITEFVIKTFDKENYSSLAGYFEKDIKPFIAGLDYKEQPLVVTTDKEQYFFDSGQETLIKKTAENKEVLGCGKIFVKSAMKKASKTQPDHIEISVELTPDYQKDYEIIPFHKDAAENQAAIENFMAKYISKPFEYLENVVGVELNFNKILYKPEKLREVSEILGEITALDEELKILEAGLTL
jgi:type I restriction enzyme M protein